MDVVMPQMGESIAQGTITRWFKAPGDPVKKDETLFEIATDKVDAEIPSPVAGVLGEILVAEGATVDVGTVVARIGAAGEAAAAPEAAPAAAVTPPAPVAAPAPPAAAPGRAQGPAGSPGAAPRSVAVGELFPASARGIASLDELRRTRSTPLVRRMAREHGVRLADVPGTGASGRVTKKDMQRYLAEGGAAHAAGQAVAAAPAGVGGGGPVTLSALGPSPYPTHAPGDAVTLEPMSRMRKEIAKHMVASLAFSAHVAQTIEVDFTAVDQARARLKREHEARGTKLTYTPFILLAVARALRRFPQFNISVDGETIIRKHDVNLGMAVALDWGLIVPVIKHADELNLAGLARASNDLALRARDKKLKPEEVQGGTFTVTNPGIFGVLSGNPIINQPQVAILGCGVIEPRVVAVDDAIAIRKRAYFTLTIDHRVLDGADGARFLKFVKDTLEGGEFD